MKKHLTPESVYIPSAAAQEAYKWQSSLESKLAGLPGQGCVCQRAMTKLWLLFQGWGEERVIGGKGVGGSRTGQKACVITTRWKGFMSSLECNRLLKRPSDYKNKNLKWERIRIRLHSRAYRDFYLCSPHLKHRTWPSQIVKLVITVELSAGSASQTSFHNKKSCLIYARNTVTVWQLSPLFLFSNQNSSSFLIYLSSNLTAQSAGQGCDIQVGVNYKTPFEKSPKTCWFAVWTAVSRYTS